MRLLLRNLLARRLMRRRIADEIKRCFDGIDLTRQSFMMDAKYLKSDSGETKFYSVIEVDKAIARLNSLISSLRN